MTNQNTSTSSHEAVELQLYIENIQEYITPATLFLQKQWQQGVFDYGKAVKYLARYVCVPAAKAYHLEFGSSFSTRWSSVFPPAVREEAAELILERIVAEFKLGNFWR